MRKKISFWNQIQGKKGEELAAKYLRSKGYKILEKGYRTRFGEIDLIASRNKTLAFVEVKARSHQAFGNPFEAITPKKWVHLQRSAGYFLNRHRSYQVNFDLEFLALGVIYTPLKSWVECLEIFPD